MIINRPKMLAIPFVLTIAMPTLSFAQKTRGEALPDADFSLAFWEREIPDQHGDFRVFAISPDEKIQCNPQCSSVLDA